MHALGPVHKSETIGCHVYYMGALTTADAEFPLFMEHNPLYSRVRRISFELYAANIRHASDTSLYKIDEHR